MSMKYSFGAKPERFWKDWFGHYNECRDMLCGKGDLTFECGSAWFPSYCHGKHQGTWLISVQKYYADAFMDRLEKLYYHFECEDLERAWQDAKVFAERAKEKTGADVLIVEDGYKGYDVYIFGIIYICPVILGRGHEDAYFKNVRCSIAYMVIEKNFLKDLDLEPKTLDKTVSFNVRALSRVPYSTNEVTGKICSPVNLDHNPIEPPITGEGLSFDFHRKHRESVDLQVARFRAEKKRTLGFWHNLQSRRCQYHWNKYNELNARLNERHEAVEGKIWKKFLGELR